MRSDAQKMKGMEEEKKKTERKIEEDINYCT
jgi:hypothetical protein